MMKTYMKGLTYLIGGLLLSTTMSSAIAAIKHTVKSGETIDGISKKYNISENILINANNLNTTKILTGQVLTIPDDQEMQYTHVVKNGDTLTSVANRFGVTPIELAKENNLGNLEYIFIGQKLRIPKDAKPVALVMVDAINDTPALASTSNSSNRNSSNTNRNSSNTNRNSSNTNRNSSNTNSPQGKKYRVQYSETLTLLSKKFNVPVNALLKANNMKYNDTLYFGQLIIIPDVLGNNKVQRNSTANQNSESINYIVKQGDTLIGLQNRFYVDFRDIAKANNMAAYEKLAIGQKLVIPTDNITRKSNDEY